MQLVKGKEEGGGSYLDTIRKNMYKRLSNFIISIMIFIQPTGKKLCICLISKVMHYVAFCFHVIEFIHNKNVKL